MLQNWLLLLLNGFKRAICSVVIKDLIVKAKDLTAEASARQFNAKATASILENRRGQALVPEDTFLSLWRLQLVNRRPSS